MDFHKIKKTMEKAVEFMFAYAATMLERDGFVTPVVHLFRSTGANEVIALIMKTDEEKDEAVSMLKAKLATGEYIGLLLLGDFIVDPDSEPFKGYKEALVVSYQTPIESWIYMMPYKKIRNSYQFGKLNVGANPPPSKVSKFFNLFPDLSTQNLS